MALLRFLILPLLVPGTLALSSCRTISLADQRLLGRPAMQFREKGALLADCSLSGQIERGRSISNNAAGGGCASCR